MQSYNPTTTTILGLLLAIIPTILIAFGFYKREYLIKIILDKWEKLKRILSMMIIVGPWEYLKRTTCMKTILTIIGPFCSLVVLYYGDLLSDIINMITLHQNCHYKYFVLSLAILVLSYLTTVLYLRFNLNETWRRAVFYHGIHVKYYILQIHRNYKAIWRQGEQLPEELEEEKNYAHNISFLEVTSESIPQLCLQIVVLREFGISTDAREGFFQVTGLVTSLVSFCLLFAKVITC